MYLRVWTTPMLRKQMREALKGDDLHIRTGRVENKVDSSGDHLHIIVMSAEKYFDINIGDVSVVYGRTEVYGRLYDVQLKLYPNYGKTILLKTL